MTLAGCPLHKKASPTVPRGVGKPHSRERSSLPKQLSGHTSPSSSLMRKWPKVTFSEIIIPKFSQYLADSENRNISASLVHDHKLIISLMS